MKNEKIFSITGLSIFWHSMLPYADDAVVVDVVCNLAVKRA